MNPDAEAAWADNSEGYAATEVAIIDTQTGQMIRRYDSKSNQRRISFMNSGFEDADSLLIRSEQDGGTALLRCDVLTGDYDTAAPLTDGTEFESSGAPYLLPKIR